jgi:hypothetical protein
MAVVYWPYDLLPPEGISLSKRPATVKGSVSISGITQRSTSDAGRWALNLRGFSVATDANIKLWRAIEGLLEGQAGQIVVPFVDLDRAPATIGYTTSVAYSGAYLEVDPTASLTRNHLATLSADAALGATRVSIAVSAGSAPEPGHVFSLGFHAYQVNRVLTSSTPYVCDIWPPLRKAAASAVVADFTRPKLLCRLASDDAMALPPLDYGRWTRTDLELIEDTGEPLDGPDMLSNGTLATDTIWSKGTGWTITGGKGVKAAGVAAALSQTIYPLAGASYSVNFTVSARTAGSVTPRLTGGSTVTGTTRTANGTYTETLASVTGNTTFELYANAAADLSVDDVTMVRTY